MSSAQIHCAEDHEGIFREDKWKFQWDKDMSYRVAKQSEK